MESFRVVLKFAAACALVFSLTLVPALDYGDAIPSTDSPDRYEHWAMSLFSVAEAHASKQQARGKHGDEDLHGKKHRDDDDDDDDDDDERDDDDADDDADDDDEKDRSPKAKLRVKNLTRDRNGANWIRLDASKSKGRKSQIRSYLYAVMVKDTGRYVHAPAATASPVAHVMLPPGKYLASVTVTDSRGARSTRTKRLKIRGDAVGNRSYGNIEWALEPDWKIGDPSISISHPSGLIPYQFIQSIFHGEPRGTSLKGSGGGCGSAMNNGGNGIGIATGLLSFATMGASAEVKAGVGGTIGVVNATGAGLKISGGSASSSCLQNNLDAINQQLAFQEEQIQDLYTIIDRDEEAFFSALKSVSELTDQIITISYTDSEGELKDELNGFMIDAGLWNSETSAPWLTGSSPNETIVPIESGDLVACTNSEPACCVYPEDDPHRPGTCNDHENGEGPYGKLAGNTEPPTFDTTLKHLSGSDVVGDCADNHDCWKNITSDANSTLRLVFNNYATKLSQAVTLCTADAADARSHCPTGGGSWDPPSGCTDDDNSTGCQEAEDAPVSNNIVPLFDQYNDALAGIYIRTVFALQQGYAIEQLINLYNYEAYVLGGSRGPIDSFGKSVHGTHYQSGMTTFCKVKPLSLLDDPSQEMGFINRAPKTPTEHDQAFNCAQQQLALAYVKRVGVLYTTMLNYIISDLPIVGSQAFPTESLSPPAEWAEFSGGLNWTPQYNEEIGKALPHFFSGARTPIEIVGHKTGTHNDSPDGSNWINDSALYQSYHVTDAVTCLETLVAWNDGGNNIDTDIANAFTSFDDCPSIFALHDDTAVNEGFYDGEMLQPYSYKVSPGSGDSCPVACSSTCLSGEPPPEDDPTYADWKLGGEALYDRGNLRNLSNNVAPAGVASQSSTGFGGIASFAIDGNTSGQFSDLTVTHTDTGDQIPWWTLTLNETQIVESIRIWNRVDCCSERLSNFRVTLWATEEKNNLDDRIFLAEFGGASNTFVDSFLDIPVPAGLPPAKSIHIEIPGDGTGTQRYLSLAEVEIYAVVGSDTPNLCRGYCSSDDECGDYRYGLDDQGLNDLNAENCQECAGGPLLTLASPMPANISLCVNDGITPVLCANEGATCSFDGTADVFYGKRYANDLGSNTTPSNEGTPATFDEMIAGPAHFETKGIDGSIGCTNAEFGDPAVGFAKQCYYAKNGNQMTWYTPPPASAGNGAGLRPGAAYLSCGNWKGIQDVVGGAEGVGIEAYMTANYTNSDVPPPGSVPVDGGKPKWKAVWYNQGTSCYGNEAYVSMTDPVCSPSDQLDHALKDATRGTIWCDGTLPGSYGNTGRGFNTSALCFQADGNVLDWTTDGPTAYGCNSVQFDAIRDALDDRYGVSRIEIDPGNTATGEKTGGPVIPIDVFYQCSDGDSDECDDPSAQCTHLVALNNDEDVTKDGSSCIPDPDILALRCSLVDGRELRVSLEDMNQDAWAKLTVSALTDVGGSDEWVARCAESDYDFCPCEGTVYYGKKYVNSLNGGAGPGSGEIATFEEMLSDPLVYVRPSVFKPGTECSPASFEDVDPAFGFFKQCFCASPE